MIKQLLKLQTLMFVILLGVGNLQAQTFCRTFDLGGPNSTCMDSYETYEINFDKYDGIYWSVSEHYTIVSIAGVNIFDYLADRNIVINSLNSTQLPIISAVSSLTDYEAISISGDFTLTYPNSSGTSVTKTYSGAANLDATQFPFLKNLLSQVKAKGKSITVKTIKPGHAQVNVSAQNIRNGVYRCAVLITDNKQTIIDGGDFPQSLDFSSNSNLDQLDCNNWVNINVPYIQSRGGVTYNWSVEPSGSAEIQNQNSSSVNMRFINGAGQYILNLEVTDRCGRTLVERKTITVGSQDSQLKINGTKITTSSFSPDCAQASLGFNMSMEPWISNDAVYLWTLPGGWELDGSPTVLSTSVVNGFTRYTYGGTNLRYVHARQTSSHAEVGDITVEITNFCGPDQVVKVLTLNTPDGIDVQLPTDIISCGSSIEIDPILSSTAVPPFQVRWSERGLDGTFANSENQTSSTSNIHNTYDAIRFGNGSISVSIIDSRGCSDKATANVSVFGGDDNEYVSGWLSGHINPDDRATVASNISLSSSHDRTYFVREISGVKQMYFYEFNNSTSKWEAEEAGITDLFHSGDNTIQYVSSQAANDYLFYLNAQQNLAVALIDRTTGKANAFSFEFSDIQPREQNYGFTLEDINGSLVRIFWKDALGSLYTGVILFDNDGNGGFTVELVPSTKIVVASPGFSFNDIVRYDVDKNKNRVFYFRSDGGFYMQYLNDLGTEIKLNGILNDDQVWNVTDVVFDNENNVYYTAQGDLFFVEFDSHENYLGSYKIETTDGVLTDQYNSGAKGYLAVNATTNVLYYLGYNGNIYQAYRDEDFATNKRYHIIKASSTTFHDNAASSLVFKRNHLYYKSSDNQVYNLFYIDSDIATCLPSYIRQGEYIAGDEVSVSMLDADNGVLRGRVFPNPTTDLVTVDVWGAKERGIVNIYDLQGQLMATDSYEFEPKTLDISNLDAGMYIIKVSNADNANPVSFKVTKQ